MVDKKKLFVGDGGRRKAVFQDRSAGFPSGRRFGGKALGLLVRPARFLIKKRYSRRSHGKGQVGDPGQSLGESCFGGGAGAEGSSRKRTKTGGFELKEGNKGSIPNRSKNCLVGGSGPNGKTIGGNGVRCRKRTVRSIATIG